MTYSYRRNSGSGCWRFSLSRFCPLLSAKLLNGSPEEKARNISRLVFPYQASFKYDGWRIFEYNGEASTRSLKTTEPKNIYTRARMAELYRAVKLHSRIVGLDGELMDGDVTAHDGMSRATSAFGSFDGQPDLQYRIFDSYQYADQPFQERLRRLEDNLTQFLADEFPWAKLVPHDTIHDLDQMWAYMNQEMALGAEGIMLRKPQGRYKWGRSTIIEGLLIAVKKWETAEGVILNVYEQMANLNEARINALGRTERSSHQANLEGKGTFGGAELQANGWTETFRCGNGPGLDAAMRAQLWRIRDQLPGKIVTFRYQAEGSKDRPRFPQWMTLRDPADMGG